VRGRLARARAREQANANERTRANAERGGAGCERGAWDGKRCVG
jgi:hypothetical protein